MTQNIGFRHLRNTSAIFSEIFNEGGVTIAFDAPKHIADLTEDDAVKVAFAFCSPEDNFCRRTGRDIASARLRADTTLSIPGNDFAKLIHTPLHQLVGIDLTESRPVRASDLRLTVLPGLDEGQQRELTRRLMWCQGYKL